MTGHQDRWGFTLVELLIVVIIIGILAAVVMPRFGRHGMETKEAALESDLHVVRQAIELFAAQHNGLFPGTIAGASSWANFVTHMTKKTDVQGNPGARFGPYLRTGIPKNPFNGLSTGTVGPVPLAANNLTGWYYNPNTGEFRANAPGVAATGIALIEK